MNLSQTFEGFLWRGASQEFSIFWTHRIRLAQADKLTDKFKGVILHNIVAGHRENGFSCLTRFYMVFTLQLFLPVSNEMCYAA